MHISIDTACLFWLFAQIIINHFTGEKLALCPNENNAYLLPATLKAGTSFK